MPDRSSSPAAALRRSVSEATIAIPGAPIALAARLIEREGFEAAYLSGAALSAGVFGVPDIGIISLDQLVEQTRVVAAATSLPRTN